jgi:hypothetical protein
MKVKVDFEVFFSSEGEQVCKSSSGFCRFLLPTFSNNYCSFYGARMLERDEKGWLLPTSGCPIKAALEEQPHADIPKQV